MKETSSQKLSQMILNTAPQELTCDEAFQVLHQYADLVSRGEDASQILPEVHRHLETCPDCREEYEALLRALKAK